MIEERLVEMKARLDEAQEEKNKSEGRLQAAMEELESEFSCSTIAEAKKLETSLESDIEKKMAALKKLVDGLEADYDWE